MTETQAAFVENRRVSRRRTMLGARVIFNGSASTMNCTVRNLSDLGGRLEFAHPVGIPEEFRVQIMSRPPVECRVVWKSGTSLGVAFT